MSRVTDNSTIVIADKYSVKIIKTRGVSSPS